MDFEKGGVAVLHLLEDVVVIIGKGLVHLRVLSKNDDRITEEVKSVLDMLLFITDFIEKIVEVYIPVIKVVNPGNVIISMDHMSSV